jgi:hypothetical protein
MFWPFRKRAKVSSHVVINDFDENYILDFCIRWNSAYPIDRWWRERHKVAFNSIEHRGMSFLDMRLEFEEYLLFKHNERLREYVPDIGEWVDVDLFVSDDAELTDQEKMRKYTDEFKQINLDDYKDD